MQHSFTPPEALNAFIRSLTTPNATPQPEPASSWPEIDRIQSDTASTSSYPPSPEWLAARDAYINHVMICPDCVTASVKVPRYCAHGKQLSQRYDDITTITGAA